MSGVFQNIDPPPPHRPASVYPPPLVWGGGHTRWVERGWGGQYFGTPRHCSALYIRKYFVGREKGERRGGGRKLDFSVSVSW
jgi:hypothetical protein